MSEEKYRLTTFSLILVLYHTARWPEFRFNSPSCRLERFTQIYQPTGQVGPSGVVAKAFDAELRAHGLYVWPFWKQKYYDYIRLIKFPKYPIRSPLYPAIFLFPPGTNMRDAYRAENGKDDGMKRKRRAGSENDDVTKRQRRVGNENDAGMNRNMPSSQTAFPQVSLIRDIWGPMGRPNLGLWG